MKRSILFLICALFILLVVDPNIMTQLDPVSIKTPTYDETAALRTNDDVEIQTSQSGALIYIDPGRGGKDEGYTASGQISEKELAMQMALAIGSRLEKAGYQVAYSRYYDDMPACTTSESCDQARLEKARELGADYILALRFNQDTSLHRGYSLFIQPDNEQLSALARNMASQIEGTSFSLYEGLDSDHYDSFPILQDSSVPAILLQLGYITNPQDYARISDSRFQNRIADAITRAFLETVN